MRRLEWMKTYFRTRVKWELCLEKFKLISPNDWTPAVSGGGRELICGEHLKTIFYNNKCVCTHEIIKPWKNFIHREDRKSDYRDVNRFSVPISCFGKIPAFPRRRNEEGRTSIWWLKGCVAVWSPSCSSSSMGKSSVSAIAIVLTVLLTSVRSAQRNVRHANASKILFCESSLATENISYKERVYTTQWAQHTQKGKYVKLFKHTIPSFLFCAIIHIQSWAREKVPKLEPTTSPTAWFGLRHNFYKYWRTILLNPCTVIIMSGCPIFTLWSQLLGNLMISGIILNFALSLSPAWIWQIPTSMSNSSFSLQ